jgi:hypothetical protein
VKYDVVLKELFTRSARGLLELLTGATVTEWLNIELPRVNAPRMDLLGRLSNGLLCNIEFQTGNESAMAERAGIYYLQTLIQHKVEHIEQIVIYLGNDPLRMSDSIQTPAMQFRFRLIDIRDVDGDRLARHGDTADVILAILARVRSQPQAIRRAVGRIAKLKGRERKVAYEELLILAGLRGLQSEVHKEGKRQMPFEIDLMQDKFFRETVERSRAEGELKMLRLQLTKRFGRLPVWARQRLENATPEQRKSWILKAVDAKTLEDVIGKRSVLK